MKGQAWFAAAAALALPIAGTSAAQNQTVYIPGYGTPLQHHSPRPAMDEQTKADLKLPPLVADGPMQVSEPGRITVGAPMLKLKVRHTVTGVLVSDVAAKGWFGAKRRLPAGSGVFGLPMGGPDGRAFVWCAPQQGQVKGHPNDWTVTCLPFGDKANLWVQAKPALMPAQLEWNDESIRETDVPDVRRQPVAFPPMTLSYVFSGWTDKGWLKLEILIDWGEGPYALRSLALQPGADGWVNVKVLGGEVALKAAVADAELAVRAPPRADAPIIF